MKLLSLGQILSLSSIPVMIHAFPLLHLEQLLPKREPQSYSVVAVDGGQPTGVSVQTVTDSIVQTSITTILSTLVITQSDVPTTVVVTSTAAVTITQAAPPVTVSAPAETKTLMVGASMTSSPYDNGMWHTTYYSSWTISPSVAVPVPVSTPIALSSTPAESSQETPAVSSLATTSAPKPDVAVASTTRVTTAKATISTTTSSVAVSATNWATAYGQWHDHPNAEGSWWW